MKIPRILIPLSLLLLTGLVRPADHAQADRDWQAYESVAQSQAPRPFKEMSRLELAQYSETRALRLREAALAFIEKHPQDPRRWIIIYRLPSSVPKFVREWGPLNAEGRPDNAVVDAVAAAEWKTKVAELKAAMANATDLPDEIAKSIATDAERGARQKRFLAKWQTGKEIAPDFTMHDLAGREVKLADYRGKVVILDFWAPWCGPCIAAMPHTQQLAAKHKADGVVVIASCTRDTLERFQQWVKNNQAAYPDIVWAFDPAAKSEGRAAKVLYDTPGIPCQFVIDREGRVVDAVIGYMNGEVILDAALAKAGIKIDPAILAQAAADLKKRGG